MLPAEDALAAIRELRKRDGQCVAGRARELVSATTTATGVLICTYQLADR